MTGPINPLDAAEQAGLKVRLFALSSLEGMYFPDDGSGSDSGTIVVGAERPPGRRNFTCAHELGHHFLGHGERYDELVKQSEEEERAPEEEAADSFAAEFLMPKAAVSASFTTRRWDHAKPTPEQLYVVSTELGVGYATLIDRMTFGLGLLPARQRMILRRVRPKQIKERLLGRPFGNNVTLLDQHWRSPMLDLEVGDALIVENGLCVPLDGPVAQDAIASSSRSKFRISSDLGQRYKRA